MRCTLAAIVLAAACLGGCASLCAPGPDFIPVDSRPEGARVLVNGVLMGLTPTVVPIDRNSPGLLRVELAGYEPTEVRLEWEFNGWFVGNLMLGGVPGMFIDLVSGNAGRFPTEAVQVKLQPATKP